MRLWPLIIALAISNGHAAGTQRLVVVGVFTSEGCSAARGCGARDADRHVGGRCGGDWPRGTRRLLGLARSGRFVSHRRRSRTARFPPRAFSLESVYTPQIVVDGRAQPARQRRHGRGEGGPSSACSHGGARGGPRRGRAPRRQDALSSLRELPLLAAETTPRCRDYRRITLRSNDTGGENHASHADACGGRPVMTAIQVSTGESTVRADVSIRGDWTRDELKSGRVRPGAGRFSAPRPRRCGPWRSESAFLLARHPRPVDRRPCAARGPRASRTRSPPPCDVAMSVPASRLVGGAGIRRAAGALTVVSLSASRLRLAARAMAVRS